MSDKEEFNHSFDPTARPQIQTSTHWPVLSSGVIKINCDVAWDSKTNPAGFAAIARDSKGVVIDGENAHIVAPSTRVAEAVII